MILTALLIIALAIIGTVGDLFIKISGLNSRSFFSLYFFVGLMVYASTAFGWFYAMKYIKLSSLGVYYSLTTILFLTIIGIFYFKENLNVYEILGIISAIISIILLGKFN